MLLKALGLVFVFGLASSQETSRTTRPGRTVVTRSGPVQGLIEFYDGISTIQTYKGIRYARPPVGNLRFREAVAPEPWNETFNAWQYGPQCAQLDGFSFEFRGEEDCLFLNIATPVISLGRLPVVVYVHGGGLHGGNGNFGSNGPESLGDIVYVSFNYRLNVLGFLNTGDRNSAGNHGIKDMITVLRWVQNNIEGFGGDPRRVTIHGFSGGSVGVHALVVSRAAAGLFTQALSHSGSMFNSWAFNRNPSRSVEVLKNFLGLTATSNENLVAQLRQIPVERLVEVMRYDLEREHVYWQELLFVPSVDPVDSEEEIIFAAPIEELVQSGRINRVRYMIGFNSGESLPVINELNADPTMLQRLNESPYDLVPSEWNLGQGSPEALAVISTFRRIYFGGAVNITQAMALQFSHYTSDREFVFGISKQAELHSQVQDVFYFRFSFSGAFSFNQRSLNLMQYPFAIHGDESPYLYHVDNPTFDVSLFDQAQNVRRRFIRLWTNFFSDGHPTPLRVDPILRSIWPRTTSAGDFMDIGAVLQPGFNPFEERMSIWREFDKRFGQ